MNDACLDRMRLDRVWLIEHSPARTEGDLLTYNHGILERVDVDGGQVLTCRCGATRKVLFYDERRDGGPSKRLSDEVANA